MAIEACAACKHQRCKCTPTCPLAPYFPANDPNTFQNVLRLFGIANVVKTLRSLTSKDQKDDAMKSIIYEANMRRLYPVHGCSFAILQLNHQIQCTIAELNAVNSKLVACRKHVQRDRGSDAMSLLQRQGSAPAF